MRTASGFDPVRPLDVPPCPVPRRAPSVLAKVRGTVTRGQYSERPGLLGTFVADPRPVDSVTYFNSANAPDRIIVSVTRSRWVNWRGPVNRAQFDALRAHVGADKVAPAFPSQPTI